jgi:hypothetical protein
MTETHRAGLQQLKERDAKIVSFTIQNSFSYRHIVSLSY